MANSFFQFKQFTVHQEDCAMKVTTDGCLFGAWAAAHWCEQNRCNHPAFLLDIGTGTGLLSLMLAQCTEGEIDGIEIDEDAHRQAAENFIHSPWKDRLHAIHGDARNFAFRKKYDLIISNPPFYEDEIRSANDRKNLAHHDVSLLLHDTLQIITQNLKETGWFYLMLPYKRIRDIRALFRQTELNVQHTAHVKQSPAHDHFRILIAGNKSAVSETKADEEIIIMTEEKKYSDRFVKYLKDYYLYL